MACGVTSALGHPKRGQLRCAVHCHRRDSRHSLAEKREGGWHGRGSHAWPRSAAVYPPLGCCCVAASGTPALTRGCPLASTHPLVIIQRWRRLLLGWHQAAAARRLLRRGDKRGHGAGLGGIKGEGDGQAVGRAGHGGHLQSVLLQVDCVADSGRLGQLLGRGGGRGGCWAAGRRRSAGGRGPAGPCACGRGRGGRGRDLRAPGTGRRRACPVELPIVRVAGRGAGLLRRVVHALWRARGVPCFRVSNHQPNHQPNCCEAVVCRRGSREPHHPSPFPLVPWVPSPTTHGWRIHLAGRVGGDRLGLLSTGL